MKREADSIELVKTEVMAQNVVKTDGVPLFVGELPKAVLESGLPVAGSW